MKKIMMTVLVLAATAFGLAGGWTHTVGPVFDEPFDDLLLPWPADSVTPVGVGECWPDAEPPFLGAEWRFWCYAVPGDEALTAAANVEAAVRDASYDESRLYIVPSGVWLLGNGWYWMRDGPKFRYWSFRLADGSILLGFASETNPSQPARNAP